MNPFLVFDLDLDATDDDVSSRYHLLLRRYPPDRHPELFAEIRSAYDALKDRRSRIKTWLFSFDRFGRALAQSEKMLLENAARPRATSVRLATTLREAHREGNDE